MELKLSATKQKKKLQNGLFRILTANHLQQDTLLMKLAIWHGHLIIKAVYFSNKKNARFQKYDSKEPGGVKSTTVEIKRIICQKKKKSNTQGMAITVAVDHAKTKKQEEKQSLFLEHRQK